MWVIILKLLGGNDSIASLKWSDCEDIPEDAVIYSMKISNVKSTDTKYISVVNLRNGGYIRMDTYPWSRSTLCGNGLPARSNWTLTFKYNKSTTFTPTVSVIYYYPIGRTGPIKK